MLCPGRHFASTEMMALTALMVLQFDVVPVTGRWVEPSCNSTPAHFGFSIPDQDIDVELRPRDLDVKWRVTFSGSDEMMGIVVRISRRAKSSLSISQVIEQFYMSCPT